MHRIVVLYVLAITASGALSVWADSRVRQTAKAGDVFTVSVTAYCIKGKTTSGEQTRRGIVAADLNLLPIDSVVRLSGLGRHSGTYTVQDSGRGIKGKEIDLFMPSCSRAKRFGRQQARLRVVRIGTEEQADPAGAHAAGRKSAAGYSARSAMTGSISIARRAGT